MNVIWAPQEKQRAFQQRKEYEVLYGGAAGGGKSEALVMEATRQVHIPHYRGILIRKTFPQLADLIDKTLTYYPRAFPGARYNASEHCWSFPSGAKIYFGSMQRPQDRMKYQGRNFDFVGFDELTHFTWEEYAYLIGRNRPNGPGTRVYIRATTNPGGIGHAWVRDRFITAAPPMTTISESVNVNTPDGPQTVTRERLFVPATVFDNEKLLENDPNYVANLAMLPEAERNALLYGDWNSFDGQVFREWVNDPEHYLDRKWTHVVEPFEIPAHWKIWRGFDFGYAKPFSVGWYAASPEGYIVRIAEYYGCTGTPNKGVELNADEIAAEIVRIEREDENLRRWDRREIVGVADPSIFDKSRGLSIADMMARAPSFVLWHGGDNTRIAGKMQFHYRFAFSKTGTPMFQVFNTCRHFIRTIPTLCYSDKFVEDIDTDMEDHIYDECRYVLMDNPIAPRAAAPKTLRGEDPLNQRLPEKQSGWFRG